MKCDNEDSRLTLLKNMNKLNNLWIQLCISLFVGRKQSTSEILNRFKQLSIDNREKTVCRLLYATIFQKSAVKFFDRIFLLQIVLKKKISRALGRSQLNAVLVPPTWIRQDADNSNFHIETTFI